MRMFNKQAYSLLPLAIILGVSVYSIGFWIIKPLSQPTLTGYEEIGQIVRSSWEYGDILTVKPWWAARIREYLGDRNFVQVHSLESEDFSHFGRLWLVSLPGHHSIGGPFTDGGYRLEFEKQVGGLWLRRYRLPPPTRVLYNFRDMLHLAQVKLFLNGSMKPCTRWVTDRWACSPHDWEYQGRIVTELGHDPREVIWAHPLRSGPLEISYLNVPGGKTLAVHTGFIEDAVRAPQDAPVTLTILIDGKNFTKVVQEDRSGYFLHTWDISSLGTGPHTVTFRVTCPEPDLRIFCFDGEIRE